MPQGMFSQRRAILSAAAIATLGLTQIGAAPLDPFARAAWDAVNAPTLEAPLTDPSDVLDQLAVDPLVRALRAERLAIELRRSSLVPQPTEVPGMDPLLSRPVSRALLVLGGETQAPVVLPPFSFRRLIARPPRPATRRYQAPSYSVALAIKDAADITGVSQNYLLRAARRESAFNPSARASTSSALGLYQFLDETWLITLRRHGASFGYGHLARHIQLDPSGRPYVSDPVVRHQVLSSRRDPRMSAIMGAAFTRDNQALLTRHLGRRPSDGETYVAHFLGGDGAVRLINASRLTPSASAAALFPRAAAANRSIFFDRMGRPRTVAHVKALLVTKGSS
jgi:Transglycosylase SLT domain